ncbi:MAG TPA: M20 family metallopeptidase [Clostridia bacterium]|nr:M20 family metallopeptidase [Clostridia bacterium]
MERREILSAFIDNAGDNYKRIALDIHEHPEVSNHEFYACKRLSEQLSSEGFSVRVDVAGHRTGFAASYKAQRPGPVLVFLAEYDALEGLGHGCGHNLFGATSLLAAAALKQMIDETGGEIRVYGTPGEEGGENGSAKGSFVREGFLRDADAALCVHPGADKHGLTGKSLGCAPVDIEFWGRAAHASGAPEKGINALDALIQVFNSINALRQHLSGDVRIHGIITRGGDAPNTVPEYAKAKFYLRAATAPGLDTVYRKVEHIVEGAALATGAKGRMQPYQNRVENTVPTPSFDAVYAKNLALLGQEISVSNDKGPFGSTDVGNVSQVVPVIQPHISITDKPVAGHSEEMKAAARSEKGLNSILLGAKALSFTALDLLEDSNLLRFIQEEHKRLVQEQN